VCGAAPSYFSVRLDLRAAGFLAAGFRSALGLLDVAPRLAPVEVAFAAGFLSAAAGFSVTDSECNRDISRDLRRAAALRWMMPFCAALSSARTASRTCSATSSLVLPTAALAFLKCVRTADRAAWLRAVRRSAWRIAFCADLVLATFE
jgi:hypothetical protein